MKINAAAIQSYQQITRQNRPGFEQAEQSTKPTAEKIVTIRPQEAEQPSRLAVQATKGNYSEFLTTEESQAMELLFSKFKDSDRFGPSYQRGLDSDDSRNPVGRLVDVKV
jgi:hypothetical protein